VKNPIEFLEAAIADPVWPDHIEMNKRQAQAIVDHLKARDEADSNLHGFLSHFKFANDAMTTGQILDNWKTNADQRKYFGNVRHGTPWQGCWCDECTVQKKGKLK
jgi:hypothetical protein